MSKTLACAVGLLVVLTMACGGSPEEKRAEEAPKGAEQASKGAEEMAKGLEEMAKGFGALTGAREADFRPVDPVSFRELQPLFPELDGWERGKLTGETVSAPFRYSSAQAIYRKDGARITAKIVDSGYHRALLAPLSMFMLAGYEKETEDGYQKSLKLGDHPAWEKWNDKRKDGELNAVVAKRFVITFDGNDIEDTRILHELAGKVDLAKLASLK